MKPSARQPATHCVVFTAFWKSPGVAVCSARPIWALHCLVHLTHKLLSAAENKCSVQGSGGSRAVCQSGKTGFLGEINKSIIGVRGERVWVQCKWEHLAEWLFIQMGTVWTGFWSKEKHVAFRTNERCYPILRKSLPKLCFLFIFTSFTSLWTVCSVLSNESCFLWTFPFSWFLNWWKDKDDFRSKTLWDSF